MKKVFFASLCALVASVSFGAQFMWTATGIDNTLAGGTSYLVHSTTVVDIAAISNTIETEGFATTVPSNYTNIGDSGVISNAGLNYVMANLSSTAVATPTAGQYFIVVVSSDEKTYAISNALDPSTGDGGATFTFMLTDQDPSLNWSTQSGSVNVPEPTVLALLALGVAGVALRRKKMA